MKTETEESPALAEIMGTDEVVQRVSLEEKKNKGKLRMEPLVVPMLMAGDRRGAHHARN